MSPTRTLRLWSFISSGNRLRSAWLITAGIAALYAGVIRPLDSTREIADSRATGLAAMEPRGLWRQMRFMQRSVDNAEIDQGIVGGVPGGISDSKRGGQALMTYLSAPPATSAVSQDVERKTVRTCSIDLVVQRPAEAVDRIRHLAESLGGFLVSSQVSGGQDATSGSVALRVPAAHFEELREQIRKLGIRVESEKVDAQDVTRQYVDQDANLRNLRAEEGQYLTILKQAKTVKDTLEVSEKLNEVRGQIEQQQAEFNALSKQIETVAVNVSLRSEAEERVFGLNWRPLYQVKAAMRDGLDGLADYASTIVSVVFLLPTIFLWLATIIIASATGWRILRWVGRRWFGWKTAQRPVQA